jgi:hypothetical protein
VDEIPHSNIAFPKLQGVYIASEDGSSKAA